MALSDAFAAIVGQSIKQPIKYKVWNDSKSVQGSLVFFGITYTIIILSYHFLPINYPENNIFTLYLVAFFISLVTTLAEAISSKGSDNFSITLIAGFFYYIYYDSNMLYQTQFMEAILFAIIAAIISVRIHFLHIDGAISMSLMAIFIYGIGGWHWTIPILTFFITSSILSKLGRKEKHKFRLLFEKSSKRDSKQVFANGGIALIIVILFYFTGQDICYYLYLVSLATANADTWATELGVFNKAKPRLITTFKQVEKGSSGAVSFIGTSSAVLGSLCIILSGTLIISAMTIPIIVLLTICGFLASIIDSIIGATIQAQYLNGHPAMITEKAFDDQGNPNKLIRGYKWLNNDIVNFLSILSAPFIYLTFTYFF